MCLSQFREDEVFKSWEKKTFLLYSLPSPMKVASFSKQKTCSMLVCVPSCDAASVCRDSLHPSPADPTALDKTCLLSWRHYYTKTTSPELLGKLLQVMQVANSSRGFHSGQG